MIFSGGYHKNGWRAGGALSALVAVLSSLGCDPNAVDPEFILDASPRSIEADGTATVITVTATDRQGVPGAGSVRLTASAGSFDGAGATADVLLVDGAAEASFACATAADVGCTGVVTITGVWNGRTAMARVSLSAGDGMPGTDGPRLKVLGYQLIDAEYSAALGRIVTISSGPNALHLYDPVAETSTSIPLALAPQAVSVSPDGLRAAVGHNAFVTYIDLTVPAVIGEPLPISADVGDVVLTTTHAYVLPRVDQWVELYSLRLSDGAVTTNGTGYIRAGTAARLHPSGTSLYGADNGLSPSDIEKYLISADGTAQYGYDSPYHGDYPMCGNLWFTESGDRIITACGRVFRASDAMSDDMTYVGALQDSPSGYQRLSSVSYHAGRNQLIALPAYDRFSDSDLPFGIYEGAFFGKIGTRSLPAFGTHRRHGRFVFHHPSGTQFYVVMQIEPLSAEDPPIFGVVRY